MHSEEYWNLLRAKYALNVLTTHEVLSLIGMNQETVCKKIKNRASAVVKKLYIGSYLSKDCFLDLMNDVNFIVRNWKVALKKPGDLNSGYNFYVEGHYLEYKKEDKVHCEYPYKCNTTLDCKYANICKSPLAEIQRKVKPIKGLQNGTSLVYWTEDSVKEIKNINGKYFFNKYA